VWLSVTIRVDGIADAAVVNRITAVERARIIRLCPNGCFGLVETRERFYASPLLLLSLSYSRESRTLHTHTHTRRVSGPWRRGAGPGAISAAGTFSRSYCDDNNNNNNGPLATSRPFCDRNAIVVSNRRVTTTMVASILLLYDKNIIIP